MRIKVAFLVLFTAWLSPAGYAQWEWPSPPPAPPPYPGSPFDEPDPLEMPRRPMSRPPEPSGRSVGRSSDRREVQDTIRHKTLRKPIPTKKRKSAEKPHETNKATSPGPEG